MFTIEGEYLYNIAAALGFVAYLMTSVLWLRTLLVLGAGFYIWTGLVLGLESMIGWHVAYGVINLAQIWLILLDNRTTGLPEAFRALYSDRFSSIKPREFRRLMEINDDMVQGPGRLLNDGDDNERLMMVVGGRARVIKAGKTIYELEVGDFVGELSVISGATVSADVVVDDEIRFVYWDKRDLKKLEARNLSLYNRFMMSVGRNIIEKLHRSTEAHLVDSPDSAELVA